MSQDRFSAGASAEATARVCAVVYYISAAEQKIAMPVLPPFLVLIHREFVETN